MKDHFLYRLPYVGSFTNNNQIIHALISKYLDCLRQQAITGAFLASYLTGQGFFLKYQGKRLCGLGLNVPHK